MEEQQQSPNLIDTLKEHLAELEVERREADSVYALLDAEGKAQVTTEAEANLIVRAFTEIDAQAERLRAQLDARMRRIERKRKSLEYLFENALAQWTADNLSGKRKSIVLADGTVGYRTIAARTVTESDATLREWGKVHLPQSINWDRAPLLVSVVQSWEAKEGQLAPGRIAQEAEQRFYIKAEKKGANNGDHEEGSNGVQ